MASLESQLDKYPTDVPILLFIFRDYSLRALASGPPLLMREKCKARALHFSLIRGPAVRASSKGLKAVCSTEWRCFFKKLRILRDAVGAEGIAYWCRVKLRFRGI
jgi:hypothetical protein